MLDTAVIPCGGLGTRLQPITRWLPKELLPVGLRPVLYWTLDEIAGAGLQRAIVVTTPLKPALEAAARTYPGPIELEFVAQQRPRGLGDAFLSARDLLAGAPFAAVLPEFLFRGSNPTREVVELHRRTGAAVALVAGSDGGFSTQRSAARPVTVRSSERGLRVSDVAVDDAPLDPGGERVRMLGRYVFPGAVFGELEAASRTAPPGSEVDGVSVLRELARRGELDAVSTRAAWFEVGIPEGYRMAVADFPAQV